MQSRILELDAGDSDLTVQLDAGAQQTSDNWDPHVETQICTTGSR